MLGVVFLGRPQRYDANEPNQAFVGGFGGVSAVDEFSAAKIAADIAKGVDLLVADNVQNLADSQQAKVKFSTTEGSYLAKPQQVVTDAKTNRDIQIYVAQSGDSISSIARKFNVTTDTIRWENNLYGDSVSAGTKLTILPISGIRYIVQEGDTAQSISERYDANANYIVAFNDAELTGLKPGAKIIIPDGEKPQVQPTYFSSGYGFAFGSQPLYGGNGYSYGYCTYYVANRRIQIGKQLPRNLGNAVTWYSLAQAAGLSTGNTPKTGAVLWHSATWIAGGLGHVAFVEEVNDDGSIRVSEMNYPYWNAVTYRTIEPSELGQYKFIY